MGAMASYRTLANLALNGTIIGPGEIVDESEIADAPRLLEAGAIELADGAVFDAGDDLDTLTVAVLTEIAKELDIQPVPSKKADIVAAIREARAQAE